MLNNFCSLLVLSGLLLSLPVLSSKHGNPANDIVEIINRNRTASKLRLLSDSPGLGCMALQYAAECATNCTGNNNTVKCQPGLEDFTEVFAPNCGVELPTFTTISGHIVGCHSKYLAPAEAYSSVLVKDAKSLSLLRNKTHAEVGVGLIAGHGGRFLWCVLFSSAQTSSTFVLDDQGQGIKQKKGCFSGVNTTCSAANKVGSAALSYSSGIFTAILLHFVHKTLTVV